MASEPKTSTRALVEQGLKDTERLIAQKQYNLSMVKARETLEYMVKFQAKRAGIQDTDLIAMIDGLYRKNIISRDSCTHYHKIRMLGNKAVHDGDSNAYNANTAYQLLSKEAYAFLSRFNSKGRQTQAAPAQRSSTGSTQRSSSGARQARRRSFPEFSPYDLLKILIPILILILIFALVRLIRPKKEEAETTPARIETSADKEETKSRSSRREEKTTEAPEEETTAEVTYVYRTKVALNVRSSPSTEGQRVALLPEDTVVEYVGAYNDEWATIMYNGAQAYVAARYLEATPAEGGGQ